MKNSTFFIITYAIKHLNFPSLRIPEIKVHCFRHLAHHSLVELLVFEELRERIHLFHIAGLCYLVELLREDALGEDVCIAVCGRDGADA